MPGAKENEISREINRLAEKLQCEWDSCGLASATIRNRKWALQRFLSYARQTGEAFLTEELVESYIIEIESHPSIHTKKLMARVVEMLGSECKMKFASIEAGKREKGSRKTYSVPDRFQTDYAAYLKSIARKDLAESTLIGIETDTRIFLEYLNLRIERLEDLSLDHCDQYLFEQSERLSPNSMRNKRVHLKSFIAFLNETKNMNDRLKAIILEKGKKPPTTLQRFLNQEETGKILHAARTTKAHPKRTLFIVTFLFQFMIRADDLCNLLIEDIDWRENTVMLRSGKSRTCRSFPLTENARYILLDYLKNERPQSDFKNVLLSCRYPYESIRHPSSSLNAVVKRVAREAAIDTKGYRFGAHVFRRTASTAMMDEGVEYATISESLQHKPQGNSYSGTTMVYLKVDIEHMRTIMLEVKPYEEH